MMADFIKAARNIQNQTKESISLLTDNSSSVVFIDMHGESEGWYNILEN